MMAHARSGDVGIYWSEEGAGPALLLIQGLGYTHEMWHRLLPLLVPDYRVVWFDNRGVGRSDAPEGPYSISQMSADAVAVLDAAGIDKAVVFGVSMGASIALELALQYPDRLCGLVVGSPACGGPDAVAAEPEVIEALHARISMTPEQGIRVLIPYIYDPSTPADVIEADLAIRIETYPAPHAYAAQLHATLDHFTWERLERIATPTLVVHGSSDRLIPPGNGRDVARRIPGARFVSLDNASHIFFTERPRATARLIRELTAGIASTAGVSGKVGT